MNEEELCDFADCYNVKDTEITITNEPENKIYSANVCPFHYMQLLRFTTEDVYRLIMNKQLIVK